MKLLALITLTAALHGAPITFATSGAISPTTPNQYFVDLLNSPTEVRTATLTASAPLTSVTLMFDNRPFLVGTGFIIALDGVEALNTGKGNLVDTTLTLTALLPFTEIRLSTNLRDAWWRLERGLVTVEAWTPAEAGSVPEPNVPEPSTKQMIGWGLIVVVLAVRWRRNR
jgi:hypothetical protein